ncbi:uncharacterized protein LAESUDRAFT_374173 [Laetiporus sulphureus 93-53]|uniref:Uncharacterized protein n=1 Tax=Laetiporus sulphureus 93-53 TaxID=1314785 RepID=A0A165CS32_9APHY|nr:uncharacterized protein LAESUDRAFT_374173 [Laetiporus sulphureus 93-53]KZT03340.1 hypothetical protein LAESUDRAFT_374173 [Laetiporus sulphureus 93-53]
MWERIRQAGRKGGDGASGFAGRRLSYACIAFSTHLSTLRARSRAWSVLRGYTLCCRVSGTRFTYAPIGPRSRCARRSITYLGIAKRLRERLRRLA